MKILKALFQTILTKQIIFASTKISLVVGTLLNLINQGGNVIDGSPISWPHLFLNYLVPFCVACYSAAKIQLRNR